MKRTALLIAILVLAATLAEAQSVTFAGMTKPVFGIETAGRAVRTSGDPVGIASPSLGAVRAVEAAGMAAGAGPWQLGLDLTLPKRATGSGSRFSLVAEARYWQLQIQPTASSRGDVDWWGLLSQQTRVDAIMHLLRLQQPKFHDPLYHSPFLKGYAQALRGYLTTGMRWDDGDDFFTNDIGHPIMGAVSSYTYTDFDKRCQAVAFGDSQYWSCIRRATIFSSLASVSWEWNPLMSESSLGHIGKFYACENGKCKGEGGWTDLVMTPIGGMGIRIASDYARAKLWPVLDRSLSGNKLARALNLGIKTLTAPSHFLNCAFNLDFKDAWASTRPAAARRAR